MTFDFDIYDSAQYYATGYGPPIRCNVATLSRIEKKRSCTHTLQCTLLDCSAMPVPSSHVFHKKSVLSLIGTWYEHIDTVSVDGIVGTVEETSFFVCVKPNQ